MVDQKTVKDIEKILKNEQHNIQEEKERTTWSDKGKDMFRMILSLPTLRVINGESSAKK